MTYVKFNIALALLFFITLTAYGQEHRCGSDHMHYLLQQRDPNYLGRKAAHEADLARYLEEMAGHRSDVVYTIPVVFHIIHNNGEENISDAAILEAVQILNRDFRKTNADTSLIVSSFQSIAADTRIEFRLAKIDPFGNCTNGIDRIQSLETYIGDDGAKLNPWPRHKYLNIWVVNNMANGVAGYAYYPEATQGFAMAAVDGIILRYDYFGTQAPSTASRSRALTHEVGHYLNLAHPWGDTNNPGVSCGDDWVDDTPVTKGFTDCDLNTDECTPGVIENAQNYMDYSYCSVMFTAGQRERMRATLVSNVAFRNNLWSESNLIATGIIDNAEVQCAPRSDFYADKTMICIGNTTTLHSNIHNAPADTYLWDVDGGNASSLTSATTQVTWDTPGWKTISLTVSNNAGSDTYTAYQSVYVSPSWSIVSGLYQEDFEQPETANDFIVFNYNNNATDWHRIEGAGYNSNHCMVLDNFNNEPTITDDNDDDVDALITPSMDLSMLTDGQLTFRYAMATGSTLQSEITDRLLIYSSKDCGKTWTLRKTIDELELITAGVWSSAFVPTQTSEWAEGVYNIPSTLEDDNVRFKFEFESGSFANNLYIDNINISGTVGITTTHASNQVKVYPNPAQEVLVVEWAPTERTNTLICMHDIAGQEVRQLRIDQAHRIELNVHDLAPGLYFVTVHNGQGRMQCKILVQ